MLNNLCETPDDVIEFIWGVKSPDDISGGACSLGTMNDIAIVYDHKTRSYCLFLETIYRFADRNAERQYYQFILSCLTNWLMNERIDTSEALGHEDIFDLSNQFPSIGKLYAKFKFLVESFTSLSE